MFSILSYHIWNTDSVQNQCLTLLTLLYLWVIINNEIVEIMIILLKKILKIKNPKLDPCETPELIDRRQNGTNSTNRRLSIGQIIMKLTDMSWEQYSITKIMKEAVWNNNKNIIKIKIQVNIICMSLSTHQSCIKRSAHIGQYWNRFTEAMLRNIKSTPKKK